jgi:hypothetical protein
MDFEKTGKSYGFSFDLYPKGDAKSEDDIALYIKVTPLIDIGNTPVW